MSLLEQLFVIFKIDLSPQHRQPRWGRWVVATIVAVAGSLLADALIVKAGVAIFPSTKGYAHFQFADYSKLTVIGVLGAAVGWPIVTRISSAPRWLYLRLAVLVTAVLLLPDLYIWYVGQSGTAVAVLVVMHFAIALVTYNAMVRIAPVGKIGRAAHRRRRSASLSTH
jgi:hypothetical protein